jgi:ATP-dependent RNA helicase DDX19/DBP5
MIPRIDQILLFSATFPDTVMRYAQQFSPGANEIKLKRDELTVGGIKQMYMDCPSDEGKYDILASLYGLMTIGSSIIFVKVRSTNHSLETNPHIANYRRRILHHKLPRALHRTGIKL